MSATQRRPANLALGVTLLFVVALAACSSAPSQPISLRLQVSLTPEELADFRPGVEAIDMAHPEWTIALENVPQGSEAERITNALAADDLPDVLRIQGLQVGQWIRRGAFLRLTDLLSEAGVARSDFYSGPLAQFEWQGELWGIPDTTSPEIVFFNRDLFARAGIEPPTDEWTYDDMRSAALALTEDADGNHPGDPAFDSRHIEQWGWNGGLTYFWQNAFVRALGGNLCANDDCTLMSFTSPETTRAIEWWVGLVRDDHAALYDPYGGSQTGVPGDPFLSGKAAMGSNGTFAIGQLNAAGSIDYDIVPPLIGVDGRRYTPMSTNGYVISARSAQSDDAWELIKELTAADFLRDTWARPGHGVPALRAAAGAVIDSSHPPANQRAILDAMEVGEVFMPATAHAFDAYSQTIDLFTRMNTGELSIQEGVVRLEEVANRTLAADREQ